MTSEIIEQHRLKLIEKFGDPTPREVDGKTYRFINENLEEFNEIVTQLNEIEVLLNKPISDDVLELICIYCMKADTARIKNIRKSLQTLKKGFSYNYYAKKNACELFKDLEKDKEIIKVNILKLINYFHAHINTSLDSYSKQHHPIF